MGGHGGLNILPQKRWNVYGRENRLKVKRDEEQAAGEQAEKDAAHRKAESEYRHATLLKRARARAGATETSGQLQHHAALPDQQAIAAAQALHGDGGDGNGKAETHNEPTAGPDGAAAKAISIAKAAKPDFDVLGFLRTEPSAQGNPEAEEARKRELRKRGEAKTQTSDPRFDAQFAFGHGLTGQSNQPWYAGSHMPLLAESAEPDRSPTTDSPDEEAAEVLRIESRKESSKAARKREKLEKKLAKLIRKEGLKKKKKKKKKEKTKADDSGGSRSADLVMALRRERDEREAVERKKARQAVLEASGRMRGEPEGKRYHSGFGARKTGFSSR